MTRQILWSSVGSRWYETGLDRGVLYPESSPAVPWNGLISVSNKYASEDVAEGYFDGERYLNLATVGDFEASLEAYSYPDEFERCIGFSDLEEGLILTQQKIQPFSLSYRTRLGNDRYDDLNYKIHLVYGAVVVPADSSYATLSSSTSPSTFTWSIKTLPQDLGGVNKSAHVVLDSRRMSFSALSEIEDILYGNNQPARIPSMSELLTLSKLRLVVVANSLSAVPRETQLSDLVLTTDDGYVYSGGKPSNHIRKTVVIAEETDFIPSDDYILGDLVYVKSSGILYQVGA